MFNAATRKQMQQMAGLNKQVAQGGITQSGKSGSFGKTPMNPAVKAGRGRIAKSILRFKTMTGKSGY